MRENAKLKFLLNLEMPARKFLGRAATFKLRNLVSVVALKFKVIPPATSIDREQGISAMVCTYNEEDWIEPSLLSVKELVDEYIVIDSSSDQTPQIVSRIKDEHGLNIKMRRVKVGLGLARSFALKLSSYRWILQWDGDFIAKDGASKYLRNLVDELDPKYYYLVYWPHLLLDGDLFHQNPKDKYHIEHWLFTYSPVLKYVKAYHPDHLVATVTHYKAILINKILSLHLRTVKPPKKLLYYQLKYKRRMESLEEKISLEDYVKQTIEERYGTSDIEKASKIFFQSFLNSLTPVNRKDLRNYPSILKEYVKRKYGLRL